MGWTSWCSLPVTPPDAVAFRDVVKWAMKGVFDDLARVRCRHAPTVESGIVVSRQHLRARRMAANAGLNALQSCELEVPYDVLEEESFLGPALRMMQLLAELILTPV